MRGGNEWEDRFSHYQYESTSRALQDCLLRAKAGIIAGPCRNAFGALSIIRVDALAHHASGETTGDA